MNIEGIQSGLVGMALFDSWQASVQAAHKTRKSCGSPLVAAAAAAFEQYIGAVETQMGAQISALASYALAPSGNAVRLVNSKDMAPFLALNIMA